jgi:hypothetical protein
VTCLDGVDCDILPNKKWDGFHITGQDILYVATIKVCDNIAVSVYTFYISHIHILSIKKSIYWIS